MFLAVSLGQPVADIGQADPGRIAAGMGVAHRGQAILDAVHGHARAGIRYGHAQPRSDDLRHDVDLGAFLLRADAVFDRVLDQRLQQHRGKFRLGRFGFDPEAGPQPFLEPHLFDAEIELQRLHFLRHGHLTARLRHQRVAQEA